MLRALLIVALTTIAPHSASSQNLASRVAPFASEVESELPICPGRPSQVVAIRGSNAAWRDVLVRAVGCPNTLVQLGPDVDMWFADWSTIPIKRCVTLLSVASFADPPPASPPPFTCPGQTIARKANAASDAASANPRDEAADVVEQNTAGSGRTISRVENVGSVIDAEAEREQVVGSARTPRSFGPILRTGERIGQNWRGPLFSIHCSVDEHNDGVRLSGFRIEGPNRGQSVDSPFGVEINSCIGVEISNMEIAGFGGNAIRVRDDVVVTTETNRDGGRITRPEQVKIFNNYIHHNQRPSIDGGAAGYGVFVGAGAWAQITANVFDSNRHAIATVGDVGGYVATRNLILQGGGYHGRVGNERTHQFDVHGSFNCTAWTFGALSALLLAGILLTVFIHPIVALILGALFIGAQIWYFFFSDDDLDSLWNCGYAGYRIEITDNAFQYARAPAISIRGTPRWGAVIKGNIFPHDDLHRTGILKHVTDVAITSASPFNIGVASDNVTKYDSYAEYGVCDFDGDGVDDLFLATGATWWYSSSGTMPWSYLNAKRERLANLRLGYFDDDERCDVLTEAGADWWYVKGGYGDWTWLGRFGAKLKDVHLGRFDVSAKDDRPLAKRRTTHALRRSQGERIEVRQQTDGSSGSVTRRWIADGQWVARPIFPQPNWQDWDSQYTIIENGQQVTKNLQGSGLAFEDLRFGDFTGDGVTDVVAINGGVLKISKSALGQWELLNPSIREKLSTDTVIVNIDVGNNADDIFKLEVEPIGIGSVEARWMRSRDGIDEMRLFRNHSLFAGRIKGFVGQFGPALGGGTLVIDGTRIGRFYGVNESEVEWTSNFQY